MPKTKGKVCFNCRHLSLELKYISGDTVQFIFQLNGRKTADGGMPKIHANGNVWDMYGDTKHKVSPNQTVYSSVLPLYTTFSFETVQADGVYMDSVKAKVCRDGFCKIIDVAAHNGKSLSV